MTRPSRFTEDMQAASSALCILCSCHEDMCGHVIYFFFLLRNEDQVLQEQIESMFSPAYYIASNVPTMCALDQATGWIRLE